MKLKNKPAYDEHLEKLLKAIDDAPLNGEKRFFSKFADKEYYETQLMFAIRKRQAADYHLRNVRRHLRADLKAAQRAAARHTSDSSKKAAFSASVMTSNTEFVHELGAFLAAIRSGIDFVTVVATKSISGVQAHSIATLIKLTEEGKSAPVLDVVSSHLEWIGSIRDYRDEVVHRLVVAAPASGWRVSHHGKTSVSTLPVVIPKKIPARASDTRRSRMMEMEVPLGLNESRSHVSVTFDDGRTEVLAHSVSYSPAKGYVSIEKYMKDQLASYDAFLSDVFEVLAHLKFQPATKPLKLAKT